ncbi:MAG: PilZ domain-containing protein [Nitrosomonadales bacterium]|nr:PilZ domain-containing protein [Nitrosomonadales bacterium]
MQTQERRNSTRVPYPSKGFAILGSRHIDLTTQDISLGGALVKFPEPCTLKVGSEIRLSLDIGFNGWSTVCRTTTDDDSTLCGLKFEGINRASYFALGISILNYRKSLTDKPSGQKLTMKPFGRR